jgi:hypothetical protein
VTQLGISRRHKVYTSVGTGAVLIGAVAYVGIADPHRRGSVFPPCPFKLLTGWNCPACGGLRMTHDLLHGDVSAAVVDNFFLLTGLPLLLAWLLWRWRTQRPLMDGVVCTVLVVAAVAWTVVRNLPGFPLVPTLYDG